VSVPTEQRQEREGRLDLQTLRRVQDQDVAGRRVLVRVDFNVPFKRGEVLDDGRIRAALPTIKFLLEQRASVTLVSHLGRPQGCDEALRMTPVAVRLSELLQRPVNTVQDCVGQPVTDGVTELEPGHVLLLENVRFHPQEKKDDDAFARSLAAPFEVFVQEAFGACHRAHASTHAIAQHLPACAGLLVQREVDALSKLVVAPEHPFIVIVGGKKAEEKIGGLFGLLRHADLFLIGGGVAYTFLTTRGLEVGNSIVAQDWISEAKRFVKTVYERGAAIVLPRDVQLTQRLEEHPEVAIVPVEKIPTGWMGMDIGPLTTHDFRKRIRTAKTIFWAGPLGAFEYPPFDKGTVEIAKAVAESRAFVVVGGGETGAAFRQAGIECEHVFVSTGGGAALAFVSGKPMPGLDVLQAT